MALSDPIADALTALRNASRVKKERVDVRASTFLVEILKVMRQEKFIHDFRLIEDKKQGILRVYLKKSDEPTRRISKILKISRPGLRVYTNKTKIPKVLNGLGLCILSTPQGVMSGEDARRRGVGGELIAKIW